MLVERLNEMRGKNLQKITLHVNKFFTFHSTVLKKIYYAYRHFTDGISKKIFMVCLYVSAQSTAFTTKQSYTYQTLSGYKDATTPETDYTEGGPKNKSCMQSYFKKFNLLLVLLKCIKVFKTSLFCNCHNLLNIYKMSICIISMCLDQNNNCQSFVTPSVYDILRLLSFQLH